MIQAWQSSEQWVITNFPAILYQCDHTHKEIKTRRISSKLSTILTPLAIFVFHINVLFITTPEAMVSCIVYTAISPSTLQTIDI